MRLILALPICAAFALSACGSSDDEELGGEPMSMEDVVDEMASAETPQAGQYRSTQELLELSIPGVPEDQIAMMRGMMEDGIGQENTYCVTEEEAANGGESMLQGMAESDCTVSRMDMSGGTIDAALECPTGQGMSGNVTLAGTMNGNGADMVMSFSTEIPTVGDATIRMRVLSERIGECS